MLAPSYHGAADDADDIGYGLDDETAGHSKTLEEEVASPPAPMLAGCCCGEVPTAGP